VRGIELGELELDLRNDTLSVALPQLSEDGAQGTRIPADNVLLARRSRRPRAHLPATTWINTEYEPVTATCLDVALSRLPSEKNLFALGIDRPHYVSVHSKWAQLTPKGRRAHTRREVPQGARANQTTTRSRSTLATTGGGLSRRAGTGDAAR